MATENNDGEREAKRLRSCETDLKVVLGSGDGEEVEWHHSQSLASKSKYIDAMLSTPMKEKDEHIISFPDIAPDIWRKMMTFLENPVAARRMDAKDALDLVMFYDKYDFVDGRELCDQVLREFFSWSAMAALEKNYSLDVDFVIDLVDVAHKSNLKSAFEESIGYIWRKLSSDKTPYGMMSSP